MLKSSESILQPQSKAVLSNVNLFIVTNQPQNCQSLTSYLQASGINFTYDFIDVKQLEDYSAQVKYSAIIYDNSAASYQDHDHDGEIESLIEKLQWCCHLYPDTPLILVTDVLGDEAAAKLIQSGVNGYVLRHRLFQLPNILEQLLFDFASQQALVKQQQDLIKHQQSQLQQLQALIKTRNSEAKQQAARLEQQHQEVLTLKAQVQSWVELEETKQEHLAHLNHELRSPISSMLGFAGMLKEQYYGNLNDRQMRYVNAMLSVGQYMLDLVNNYLDIAKIDANKQALDLEKLAVAEVCQNALFCLEKKAEQKGLELNLELDDEVDFCWADSRCLRQILINLLSNAVKFTDRGSVVLEVKQDREFLNFAVIDTGSGISAANMTKLFKPFPQISNHRESTGLGLALSRKLARLHQGDIVVTSKLEQGSCFTLRIPKFNQ
ncbi:MAG: HAMP domain-containing sensor histidine kinase [Cyanobacteria bacterium J06600_6]